MGRIKKITSVSEVLRIFGACAVIVSMSLFLLEGWSEGNDIQRYLKLLGLTGLLTGSGIGLSHLIKEFKGARLFFGLSLISVVANFTILGALIYSMYPLDGQLIEYPAAMTWSAVNQAHFWPICIGAIILLALLTRFSYSIFARKIAGSLTVNFLIMNSLLLIPVRHSIAISVLSTVALIATLRTVQHLCKNQQPVMTAESKFALATLFAPGLITIIRALTLYHANEVLLITLFGLGYVSLRTWITTQITTQGANSVIPRAVEVTQYCLGLGIAKLCADLLPNSINDLYMAILAMIVIAFSADQIKYSKNAKWKSVVLAITTLTMIISNVSLAVFTNILTLKLSGLCISMTVLALTSFAVANQVKEVTFARLLAVIGAVISLLTLMIKLVQFIQLSSWMMVGLVGIMLIVGASLYERFGLKFTVTKPNKSTPNQITG